MARGVHSELFRAKRTVSNSEAIERGVQKVRNIFLANGYRKQNYQPSDFQNETHKAIKQQKKRDAKDQNITFISLPFIDDDLSRKNDAKVRASQLPVKIAWQKRHDSVKHPC